MRTRSPIRRLEVFLIKPTKYDDDGYVLRHARGILPNNSLACLFALTEDVRLRGGVPGVDVRAHLCDEAVEAVPERRMCRLARRPDTRVLACFVGAQTNQFPRVSDLAHRYRGWGMEVLIGGFHVSGTLAMAADMPAHLQALMDAGMTLVTGEVEETWGTILADAASGELAPRYDTLDDKPDLATAPMPHLDERLMSKFVYRHFGTVDASRGCPFRCSFCTIINVQGRKMRVRQAQHVADAVRANFAATGTHHFFFTDDNFARNAHWREIFEQLIQLREREGIPLRFLMQVDTLSHKIADFIPLARRAGCFQVFIGMESLDPDSLADAGKKQNRVGEFTHLIEAWRDADILTHVGYIIGFPHDTVASVRACIDVLKNDLQVDLAAFFMLTPLPGSADHRALVKSGTALDDDLNAYDTFHPVVDHPRMSRAEWYSLYREAWATFYTPAHMRRQVAQRRGGQSVTLLQMYMWYKSAAVVEQFHPMMTGFLRLKPRTERRPGFPVEGRLRHWQRRLPELGRAVFGYAALLRELHEVWEAAGAPGAPATGRGQLRSWGRFLSAMFGGAMPAAEPEAGPPTQVDRLGAGWTQ